MSLERQKRIDEYRQRQPIEELRRKEDKASGRWSKRYWMQETIDRARREAEILIAKMCLRPMAPDEHEELTK